MTKDQEAAKKNKVGNCGVVTPAEAEDILRSFYGLPLRKDADGLLRIHVEKVAANE